MDFVGPIIDIIGLIGPSIRRSLRYHFKLNKYKTNLGRRLAELQSRMEDIESRIKIESRYGKIPKKEVENWLKTVKEIVAEAESVEDEAKNVNCFSRSYIAKLADQKTQEIMKEIENTRGSNFESLVVDDPSSGRYELPAPKMAGEKDVREKIWRCLMENHEVGKIGVCGMGGIGKTTIMKHIHNDLLKEATFARVIWVTVSQALCVVKLQNDIAFGLKEKLDDGDTSMRAGKLSKMLEKQGRYVLILDDVWESFALQEVGIPEPTPHSGCKLVLTTRKKEVARSMGCQIVQVKPLSMEEALKLFSSNVGEGIMNGPTLEPTVKLVVKECAGLPLAITTVASSMRGICEPSSWETALCELREQKIRILKDVEDKVFGRLKLSYSDLKYEQDQHCFLSCALYPEGHEIKRDEIIEYWITEGLIDEMGSREAMKRSGHAILQRLEENCLVQRFEGKFGHNEYLLKIHDVVRDMALHMTRKMFLVKAGMQLEELPEWNGDIKKVSLMHNSISNIPRNMQSPDCQNLAALLLSHNKLGKIPESFFDNMPNLKILDLSWNPIENLPNSLSNLENLTALLLCGCSNLESVPSFSKLQALKKLDLGSSGIKDVPQDLKMLTNLRYLNLGHCSKLEEIPNGTISNFHCLQHLQLLPSSSSIRAEEIRELNRLEVFEGGLVYAGTDLNKCVCFPERLTKYLICMTTEELHYAYRKLWSYNADVSPPQWWSYNADVSPRAGYSKKVAFVRFGINTEVVIRLPSDIQQLDLIECKFEGVRSLNEFSGLKDAVLDNFKECSVEDCEGLELLFSSWCAAIQSVEILRLGYLTDLKAIVGESIPPPTTGVRTFSSLKDIQIDNCGNIKKLFSGNWVKRDLHNLEEIRVIDCKEMEEMISISAEEEGMGIHTNSSNEFSLPKLRKLVLYGLPELKCICSPNGVRIVSNSLQVIEVWDCPNLKRIPLFLPLLENGNPSAPPSLQVIKVNDTVWWESLEWDHPTAKDVLQRFVRFSYSLQKRIRIRDEQPKSGCCPGCSIL